MPNKRIKKKIAKTNFCKSPVWHGAKIKTKDVRVQTYRGKFCDWGLATRERPKLKPCQICGKTRRAGFFKCCIPEAWEMANNRFGQYVSEGILKPWEEK